MKGLVLLALIVSAPAFGQDRKVNMVFTPQSEKFEAAAEEYRRLWVEEGPTIIQGMERGSGLTFREREVKAVIFEGPSSSGFGDKPMMLRASYPPDVKKATLVADQQVVIESGRKGLYDYDTAWKWAMAISKEDRASRFAAIVKENRR